MNNITTIQNAFDKLTQDVGNLETKDWMSTAIISHLTRWLPAVPKSEIELFVADFFNTTGT